MRLPIYFAVGLLITLAIFSFMRFLISGKQEAVEQTEIAAVVEIYRPPPPKNEPEPEPEPEPEETLEPGMETLAVSAVPTPRPTAQVENLAPSLVLGDISLDVGAVGSSWSAPLAGAAAGGFSGGEDNQGYIEVTPFSTGQPNVPEMAWRNKINGWVLVAFNVKRNGQTANVRVLDANPRGVFEDHVVWAVSQWRYSVKGLDKKAGDLILTQKVELFWKDYPANSPSLEPR